MTPRPTGGTPPATKHGFDAASFLTIYIFLFCAIPSYLTIPALGSVGRLSVLWGLVGIVWWAFYKIQLTQSSRGLPNPVKIALLVFLCALGISFAIANLRGLPAGSSTTADSSLLRLASWAGVSLVALDGLNSRERLNTLLRRLVLAGALMACLGIAQFATGKPLVDSFTLPGFAVGQDVESIQARGAFTRAAGMAAHPLEYGSLLCMVLPVAIALAVTDRDRALWRRSWPAVAISLAVVLSVSRSALIGVFVGLVLLAPSIPPKIRLLSIGLGSVGITAMAFVVPGLIGTLRGLFTSIGGDSSTLSRTDSVGDALQIALRNPVFGQGFGTFLPGELILDNQYLLLLIEGGVLGIIALLALAVSAMVTAWRTARLTSYGPWKVMCPAVAAGVAAATVTLAFFDGLSFPITAGAMFVMVSVCGAMLNVESLEGPPGRSGSRYAELFPEKNG